MSSKFAPGRPREYNPEEALTAALAEFRARGFTATSLDDLSRATNMARPSLYAAFGNKFEIYRKAVRQYSDRSVERRNQALFHERPLQNGLESYFGEIVDAYMSADGAPIGCPVLSVISGEAAANPAIGKFLAASVEKADAQFIRRMKIAADGGEISCDADIAGLAAMAASLQHSLAIRARANEKKAKLLSIARSHIALLLRASGYFDKKIARNRL